MCSLYYIHRAYNLIHTSRAYNLIHTSRAYNLIHTSLIPPHIYVYNIYLFIYFVMLHLLIFGDYSVCSWQHWSLLKAARQHWQISCHNQDSNLPRHFTLNTRTASIDLFFNGDQVLYYLKCHFEIFSFSVLY